MLIKHRNSKLNTFEFGAFLVDSMNALSYWEYKTWLEDIDFAIVGSGIVGLTTALSLRESNPNAKIVVFEKGVLPSGASTKNAGFACFGSVSEILDDLSAHSEDEVIHLIRKRYHGLQQLRKHLNDVSLGLEWNGGYELFSINDIDTYAKCMSKLSYVNELAKEAISAKKEVFLAKKDPFSFKNTQKNLIFNQFEGQIDTGLMMKNLIQLTQMKGVFILNSVKISSFSNENCEIVLKTDQFGDILTKKLFITTNGFAKELLNEEVQPARAQVLITKPIPNLPIKGTFHLDKGFYYFRNIDNRILFGGGRNLDIKGETTTKMGITENIQHSLRQILDTVILPNTDYKIDQRWSGIMGVGPQKKPIVKMLAPNVYCGVRMGGMGVAIGSLIGKELSDLAHG